MFPGNTNAYLDTPPTLNLTVTHDLCYDSSQDSQSD